MPIPFQCPHCGKTGKLADKFAGKKVKCHCGKVVAVAEHDFDLDNIQYEVVTDVRQRAMDQAAAVPAKLTKKQREEKVLAEKLGEDWRNPEPQYYQVDDDAGADWNERLFEAMLKSPMLSLVVYAISLGILTGGIEMLEWAATNTSDTVRFRRRNPSIYLIILGSTGALSGLGIICASLGSSELTKFYSKGKITFLIAATVIATLFFVGYLIYKFVSYGSA